jgi:hypothetical protein
LLVEEPLPSEEELLSLEEEEEEEEEGMGRPVKRSTEGWGDDFLDEESSDIR